MKYFLHILLFFFASAELFGQCESLIWSDEFEGSELDLTKWDFDLGNGCPNLCGWGNNELEYYTDSPENIYLEDGFLHIRAQYEQGAEQEYTSARIVTRGQASFTSGRIEARIQMPEGQGFWPAFWMLPEDYKYGNWPLSGEIDITEVLGNTIYTNHGTIHYGGKWPFNLNTGSGIDLNQSLADDFHTYAVEWSQNELRWFIDGQLFNVRTADDLGSFPWRFDTDFHILLNLAIGGNWPGYPDASTVFPSEMIVDYVRVYHIPEMTIIQGEKYAFLGDQISYFVQEVENENYSWTANGGSIISGENSSSVVVLWEEPGMGSLELTTGSGDCQSSIAIDVRVGDECEVILADNEEHFGVHWSWFQGNFSFDPVPSPNEVNSSAVSARWTREGQSDDRITFTLDGIPDATPIGEGERTIAMKVFTNAPEGTTIEVRLMNEAQSNGSIFGGSYITLQAETTVSYEWEQLYFTVSGAPNSTVDPTTLNQFQVRMLSEQQLGYLLHMDDPSVIAVDCVPMNVVTTTKEIDGVIQVIDHSIILNNSSADYLEVYDLGGRLIGFVNVAERSASIEVYSPGVYMIHLVAAEGRRTQKIIVQ